MMAYSKLSVPSVHKCAVSSVLRMSSNTRASMTCRSSAFNHYEVLRCRRGHMRRVHVWPCVPTGAGQEACNQCVRWACQSEHFAPLLPGSFSGPRFRECVSVCLLYHVPLHQRWLLVPANMLRWGLDTLPILHRRSASHTASDSPLFRLQLAYLCKLVPVNRSLCLLVPGSANQALRTRLCCCVKQSWCSGISAAKAVRTDQGVCW